jgi:beta-lactamase regulating signal transducer with metallopeptidase domain
MSSEGFVRGLCAFIFAVALAIGFHRMDKAESQAALGGGSGERYASVVVPLLLPGFIVLIFLILVIVADAEYAATRMLSVCFGIFLHICVYYALLIVALPILRKVISAKACAILWLLPNLLYFTQQSYMSLPSPSLIFRLPAKAVEIALWVWLAGFAAVLTWRTVSHLVFRRQLLKDAQDVTDPSVRDLWLQEQQSAHVKKPDIRLVVSPNTTSPLSIGLFRKTLRVVLPDRSYTDEELALIFRHELVHIQRRDIGNKFFLAFCTAMCWFNPLMWIAMRRSAEDMELSCDEAVLSGATQDTRRIYADLILRSAGDGRGYTTCLSASASALRYRLRNIMQPRKRFLGGVTAALVLFALIVSCGHVALAYGGNTAGELVFSGSTENVQFSFDSVNWRTAKGYQERYCSDESALMKYIAGLHLYRITGNYSFPVENNQLTIIYRGPEGTFGVDLRDRVLTVTPLSGAAFRNTRYYLYDRVDWGYVESLLGSEVPTPHPPNLMLYFNDDINKNGVPIHATKTVLSIRTEGEERKVSDGMDDGGAGGVFGYPVTEVLLTFSYEPVNGYEVQVENWDRTTSYFISSDELAGNLLPLAPYSAHYTVYGRFESVGETIYEMQFRFDVGLPE